MVFAQESTVVTKFQHQHSLEQDTFIAGNPARYNKITGLIDDFVQSYQSPPSEKIYLHLDRTGYLQADTIWFKAYLWYGSNQIPDTLSRVLHIELISLLGKIEQSKKILVDNGTAQGDICLDKNITPGRYVLRAYTRLMQNDPTGEPFCQIITIKPSKENFQVECTPSIINHSGNDSLKVSFRFYEIDTTGNLRNNSHNVKYILKTKDRKLCEGQTKAVNSIEQVFRCSLSGVNENDTEVQLNVSIQKDDSIIEKQYQISLFESIDVQFFPEGGNLVNGLKSMVAFKAIGTDGVSRNVKGIIIDEKGDTLTSFVSTHRGMGFFPLKPEANKEYFAQLRYLGRLFKIPLPKALSEGCMISVVNTEKDHESFLMLNYSPSIANPPKYVVGSAYGKVWFSSIINTAKNKCQFRIPLEYLPEGICRITVLDANYNPECERLFYVDKKDRFKIEIIPDRNNYKTKDKVSLTIQALRPDGKPAETNLSLAIVDKELAGNNRDAKSILAYKLLESELKGTIEDAGFYFKGDSVNHRALDLLMLTQGYRKLLRNGKDSTKQKFTPERDYFLSGRLELLDWKSRPKKSDFKNVTISLMHWTGQTTVYQAKPDSVGKFSFQLPLFYGESKIFLLASTLKKKPFKGEIYIDSTVATSPRFVTALANDNASSTPAIEYVRQLQSFKKIDAAKKINDLPISHMLKEVVVKVKDKNWYKRFDKHALKIINLDSIDPTGKKYESLNDVLIREFKATPHTINGHGKYLKTVLLPCVSAGPNEWYPIYVMNDGTYCNESGSADLTIEQLTSLSLMHMTDIKRLMVLSPSSDLTFRYADENIFMLVRQSVVVIETYKKGYRGDPQGGKNRVLEGLNAPREFYSPHYNNVLNETSSYDGRTTLFWAPSVHTNSNGLAKVEFYTSDRKTTLDVQLNGMEVMSGAPGQGNIQINTTLKNK